MAITILLLFFPTYVHHELAIAARATSRVTFVLVLIVTPTKLKFSRKLSKRNLCRDGAIKGIPNNPQKMENKNSYRKHTHRSVLILIFHNKINHKNYYDVHMKCWR